MPIEPFKIVNEDGTTNQSEYERCIKFLNNYITGDVDVYTQLTWTNPLEVDMSQDKSALDILHPIISGDNRLLTKSAFSDIKKLFTGLLDRYGSTIHTYGRYLEDSSSFTDGPGYMYDVFNLDKDVEVKSSNLNNNIKTYYLDDRNHTVLEYNDLGYSNPLSTALTNRPTSNIPKYDTPRNIKPNLTGYPDVYKGNLSGIYSDFQRLSGQYTASSTLFYYSECNDILYTTGADNYLENRLGELINFNYHANVANKTKPTRGIDTSLIIDAQAAIQNGDKVNAYITPSVINPEVNYLSPTFFTADEITEWYI